ncbi:MAG: sugar transferase [Acidobacteriota bacterium]
MFCAFAKRLLDVLISAAALLLLAPVMAVVAILVRLKLGSPVIFRQPRPGYREATFHCMKFRSMTDERDAQGQLLTEELRLTEFGKSLRRTSLDELPQLWNVLTGDMSLVGPRPLQIRYLPRYSKRHRRRHTVPPGITGWAQINGRNDIEWDRRLELDIWYVDHRSLWLDLKILVMTFWTVVSAAGAAKANLVSIEEFWGICAPDNLETAHDPSTEAASNA